MWKQILGPKRLGFQAALTSSNRPFSSNAAHWSEGKRWKRRLKTCEIIPTYSNEQNVGAHLRGSTNFQEFWITKIDYQNM